MATAPLSHQPSGTLPEVLVTRRGAGGTAGLSTSSHMHGIASQCHHQPLQSYSLPGSEHRATHNSGRYETLHGQSFAHLRLGGWYCSNHSVAHAEVKSESVPDQRPLTTLDSVGRSATKRSTPMTALATIHSHSRDISGSPRHQVHPARSGLVLPPIRNVDSAESPRAHSFADLRLVGKCCTSQSSRR